MSARHACCTITTTQAHSPAVLAVGGSTVMIYFLKLMAQTPFYKSAATARIYAHF